MGKRAEGEELSHAATLPIGAGILPWLSSLF